MSDTVFLKTLNKELTSHIPFWFMRQAGRYLPEYQKIRQRFPSFLEFCYSPKEACKVTLQPIRRFDMDAAILFSDILVIPDALGQKVSFVKGEGPQLDALKHPKQIEILDVDKVEAHLEPVFETVSLIRSSLDNKKSLIGFAGAPWTVACYMLEGKGSKEFAEARAFAYLYPDAFQQLLDRLVEATSRYLVKQVDAGADALQLFDSWAGLVPEHLFSQAVIQPTKAIVQHVKSVHPKVSVIGFAKGAGIRLTEYAKKTGVDAVAIDAQTPRDWAIENLGGVYCLQGNIDNVLLGCDKQKVIEDTQALLEKWKDIPFIANLGHGILPHTPIENVEAVSDVIRNYRRAV